jgi:glycosyltransferase involved in cell wall biosynthesis
MSPSVAIVMATFNGERFLPAQLESFLRQTHRPDVLIASDDGSRDGTLEVLQRFAGTAPFPVVIRQNPTQLGYGENFLAACEHAETDLIAFSDQDDVWLPNKLARSIDPFALPRTMLSVHAATLIDAGGNELGPYTQHIRDSRVAAPLTQDPWGFFSGFTMTIRRRLLTLIPSAERGPDMNQPGRLTAHDRWVYFLASCLGDTVMLEESLALYRQHDQNLFGKGASKVGWWMKALGEQRDMLARTEHYQKIAEHRAQLLRDAVARQPCEAEVLEAAADHWRKVELSERKRVDLYRGRSLSSRLSQLLQNLRDGTYVSPTDGALRQRAVARDLLGALLPSGA